MRLITIHDATVTTVGISDNGGLVLTGARDGMIRLWSRATGELLRIYGGHAASITSVTFSPGGLEPNGFILSGDSDKLF